MTTDIMCNRLVIIEVILVIKSDIVYLVGPFSVT